MEVFILVQEPYHDNSSILGVFYTERMALTHAVREIPGVWEKEGWYVLNRANVVAQRMRGENEDDFLIYKELVQYE